MLFTQVICPFLRIEGKVRLVGLLYHAPDNARQTGCREIQRSKDQGLKGVTILVNQQSALYLIIAEMIFFSVIKPGFGRNENEQSQ